MIPHIPSERCSKCEIYSKCVSKLDRLLSGWIRELNDQLELSANTDFGGACLCDAPSADFRDDPVDLDGEPRCRLIEGEIRGDCLGLLGESDCGLGNNGEEDILRNPMSSPEETSIIDGNAVVGGHINSNIEFGERGNCGIEGDEFVTRLELGSRKCDQSSKDKDIHDLLNCHGNVDARFLINDCSWSGKGSFVEKGVKPEVGVAEIENDENITKPRDEHESARAHCSSPGSMSDGCCRTNISVAIKSELSDVDYGSFDASIESANSGDSVLNLINHVDVSVDVDQGRLWDGEENDGKELDGMLVPDKDREGGGALGGDRSDQFCDLEMLGSEKTSTASGKSCVDVVPMVEGIFKTNVLPAEDVIPSSLNLINNKEVPIGDGCTGADNQNSSSSFLDLVQGPIGDSGSTSGGIVDSKNHFVGSNSVDLANCCRLAEKPSRKRRHTDHNWLGCGFGDGEFKMHVPIFDVPNGVSKRRNFATTVANRNFRNGPPDTLIGGSSLDCGFLSNLTADRGLLSSLANDGALRVPQTLSTNFVAAKSNSEALVDHSFEETERSVEQLMLTSTNDVDIAEDGIFSGDLSDDPLHSLAISSEAPYDIPSIEQYLEFIGGKTYRCRICSRLFSNKRRYPSYRHVRLHLKTGQFPCRFCDKRFARKDYVIRHMRTVHAS